MIDKVKIGPVTYDVEIVHEPRSMWDADGEKNAEGEGTLLEGDIVYSTQRIRISDDLHPDQLPFVLLHEAIHGVLQHAGHIDQRECDVMALGYGLVALLRDNPDLVKFVVSGV